MATAARPLIRDKLYIGGEWVEPAGTETIDVINPTTEEVIGRIPEGTPEDVDRAVRGRARGVRGVVADVARTSARELLRRDRRRRWPSAATSSPR